MRSDEAQGKYEKLTRKSFQPMPDYLRELRMAKRRLEKADVGSLISEVSYARKMLRASASSCCCRSRVVGDKD